MIIALTNRDLYFIIFCVIGSIAFLITRWYRGKKRAAAFKNVANEMGFEFEHKGKDHISDIANRFRLFDIGSYRRVRNLLHGELSDLRIRIFDYSYTKSSGKRSRTYRQSVVAFDMPARNLTKFSLRPETLFHKLGSVIGFKDINFQDHPEFSKRFHLTGKDEQAIRELFTIDLIHFLEARGKLAVEADGQSMIVYKSGSRSKAQEIPQFLEEALEVCNQFG